MARIYMEFGRSKEDGIWMVPSKEKKTSRSVVALKPILVNEYKAKLDEWMTWMKDFAPRFEKSVKRARRWASKMEGKKGKTKKKASKKSKKRGKK